MTPCWGKELTRFYIKRCLVNHSVHDKLFSCAREIIMQKLWHVRIKKKTIGNKKLYHIFMHSVSKDIGNQQCMLSPIIFLEVLSPKVDSVMLV